MIFTYQALQNGQKKKGDMEASNAKEIADYLKKNGYFPIEIKPKSTSPIEKINSLLQQVSFQDVTYMTRQFAIMLDAGLTLIDSIEIIKKQVTNVPMKKMLEDLDKALRDGKTFSQALEKYPRQFSHFYVALIKSGEASGKLDDVLSKLAENLEEQRAFRQKIRNALIYPIFIIIAMAAMMFVMFAFVMPQLLSLYESFEVELPASTMLIMAISNFMEANWLYVLIGILVVLAGLYKLKNTKKGKVIFDRFTLRLPVFGNIITSSALVEASRTLSILISSGVPILDALSIVIDVNENTVFQNAFVNIKEKVEKGMSIGSAMANETVFPESLIQMTIVGEQTGHLDVTLFKLADYYQTESEMAVKAALSLMEPAILVVLGVSVGFLVMSVITPIFSLTNSLQ